MSAKSTALSLTDVLEGLNPNDIELVFAMILTLKHQRQKKPTTASLKPAEVAVRLKIFERLLRSFMALYLHPDSSKLGRKLEEWFNGQGCPPVKVEAPEYFPMDSWDLFEGLEPELWHTLVALIEFLKRATVDQDFGKD